MNDHSQLIRILVLEDNLAVADRLCRILRGWGKGNIVGNCALLKDALTLIESTEIDLLVADIHLPDGSGLSAIEALRLHQPQSQSIVISALSERPLVINALRVGATGYILKDDDSVGIVEAVEAILDGKSPISVGIARHIIDQIQSDGEQTSELKDNPGLTSREIEILNAIAKGFTNREVAEIMSISPQTVPVHIRNIYRKLQARNRTEATYEARRMGLIGT